MRGCGWPGAIGGAVVTWSLVSWHGSQIGCLLEGMLDGCIGSCMCGSGLGLV